MSIRFSSWRWVIGVMSVAVITGLGLATPATAHAAPGPITRTEGSLTLHKHVQASRDADATPRQPAGAPLAGVEFTLYTVTTNTTDQTLSAVNTAIANHQWTWDAARKTVTLSAGHTYQVTSTTPAGLKRTDSTGTIRWDRLPIGVYLVVEGRDTKTPSNNIVEQSAPFLVTIPYTGSTLNADVTPNQWVYDVVVYPKNATGSIHKAIQTVGDTTGHAVTFTLSVPIPYLPAGGSFREFTVSDEIDARFTVATTPPIRVGVVTSTALDDAGRLRSGTAGRVSMLPAGNYQLTTGRVTAGRTSLVVTLNAAGRTAMTGNQGKLLVVIFTVDATGVGDIPNTSTVTINGHRIESNRVVSPWGQLTIHKMDTANTGTALPGATFELYRSTVANATVKTPFSTATTQKVALTASDGGAAGHVTSQGLLLTDQQGNASVKVLKPGIYYVKEVAAPKGYILNATPRVVEVKSGASVANTGVNWLNVVNDHQTGPQLPLTGSQGQVALSASGIAVLMVAAGMTLVARRRRVH